MTELPRAGSIEEARGIFGSFVSGRKQKRSKKDYNSSKTFSNGIDSYMWRCS